MVRRRTLADSATDTPISVYRTAEEFLQRIYPQAQEVRLEEIEAPMAPNGVWKVTLGFYDPTASYPPGSLGAIGGFRARIYKSFEIDPRTGKVQRMKMRMAEAK